MCTNNDSWQKQFYEEHGRYPNDDDVMEWSIRMIAEYREETAFSEIAGLITREYSDYISEVFLIGNRWDDGDKYIVVRASVYDNNSFVDLSEKVKQIFGTKPTHVISYDSFIKDYLGKKIESDYEKRMKKIYPL